MRFAYLAGAALMHLESIDRDRAGSTDPQPNLLPENLENRDANAAVDDDFLPDVSCENQHILAFPRGRRSAPVSPHLSGCTEQQPTNPARHLHEGQKK